MKNKLQRFLSSLLTIAILVSMLSVFAFATEAPEQPKSDEVRVIYSRNFDEGWDLTNGFTVSHGSNNLGIDYEETLDYSYNYFMRFQALNYNPASVSLDLLPYLEQYAGSVLKASFKADDYPHIAGDPATKAVIMTAKTGLASGTQTATEGMSIDLLAIQNGHLLAYGDKDGNNLIDLGLLEDEWIDIAIVFDWDQAQFTYTVYYGENYSQSQKVAYDYKNPLDKGLGLLTLGIPASNDESRFGSGFCVDNFSLYQRTKTIYTDEQILNLGHGELVDASAEKTVEILSSSEMKSKDQVVKDSLYMKLGVDYVLSRGQRTAAITKYDEDSKPSTVYGAPQLVDGKVMVPLETVIDYVGYFGFPHKDGVTYVITNGENSINLVAGRSSATVSGERVELSTAPGVITDGENSYVVIALEDVTTLFPKYLTVYDEIGFIMIYEDTTPDDTTDNAPIINRENDFTLMVDKMKEFVFDVNSDSNININSRYYMTGNDVYSKLMANTKVGTGESAKYFQHPYIGANQSTFDKLAAIYAAAEGAENYDAKVKGYLATLVGKAEAFYAANAELNADTTYNGIKADKVPVNVYKDGINPTASNPDAVRDTRDGYDPVYGRLTSIVDYSKNLLDLAFAYQVTGDDKYAMLAYDWAVALGTWRHWGPGSFRDCAEATMYYAMAYDWLYNAFVELYGEASVRDLAKVIFEKGVHEGYNISVGKTASVLSTKLGIEANYTNKTTYINALGSAGMIIGALAIMEYQDISEVSLENEMTAGEEMIRLVGHNMMNLIANGLDAYAKDGSYAESPTNWNVGTNAFFKLTMALNSATGSDYGFMNTCGIEKTCYYAVHIENSEGEAWNYNEAPIGETMDTHMFNFVAGISGDSAIAALRDQQLTRKNNPKSVSIFDMLFYPFDGIEEKAELPLDYCFEGMDAFVSRDSWEPGALYTGIMGGKNGSEFAQLDAGNFIYSNKGIDWFIDLGGENPACYNIYDDERYNYYRNNGEGQNVLLVLDKEYSEYGQVVKADADIVNTFVNEHGSYAILDTTTAYPASVVKANRGIFITNDKTTVVIQDEVNFGIKVQDVAWVAHTAQEIIVSEDGRTAYLTSKGENGGTYTLRATLVSPVSTFTFSVKSANDFIIERTYTPDISPSRGYASEYGCEGIQRLVIEASQVMKFNVAVVLEMVDSSDSIEPVGYEWTNMTEWVPATQGAEEPPVVIDPTKRGKAEQANIKKETAIAKGYFDAGKAFTENLNEFYAALTAVEYNASSFTAIESAYVQDYNNYKTLRNAYTSFMEAANETLDNIFNFANMFSGVTG